MNEGIGGTMILAIIVVFMVFVLSYMAFNVNYTKAFRMKNKVISTYEKYNGKCPSGSECRKEIEKYAQYIGFSPAANLKCEEYLRANKMEGTPTNVDGYYCEYKIEAFKANYSSCPAESIDCIIDDLGKPYYYKILTRVNIEIPIVQNALPLQILNSSGDTTVFNLQD